MTKKDNLLIVGLPAPGNWSLLRDNESEDANRLPHKQPPNKQPPDNPPSTGGLAGFLALRKSLIYLFLQNLR